MVEKRFDDGHFKKYIYEGEDGYGKIYLQRYNGNVWNLEIMEVHPQGCGIGSKFLTYVLQTENLLARDMTVQPSSDDARRFFQRHGFDC